MQEILVFMKIILLKYVFLLIVTYCYNLNDFFYYFRFETNYKLIINIIIN